MAKMVYISCHAPEPARALADALTAAGHTIVSTWHAGDERPAATDAAAWQANANRNFEQIETANTLVLIASPEHIARTKYVPGGKFVEAGYAHGLTNYDGDALVKVFVLGGAENGMLWGSGFCHIENTTALLAELAK